ncbi:MAG: TonB-dependent receptor, partial [Muribaculaceae bacterium]|nr:TonB-dependent receptor [Muribaculaceae bacterium]
MRRYRKLIPFISSICSFLRIMSFVGMLLIVELQTSAQNITVSSRGRNASEVFAEVMKQSGKNFIYSSDLLKGLKIRVKVKNKPLEYTLDKMFRKTDIEYSIRGNNILLKKSNRLKVKDYPVYRRRLQADDDTTKVGIFRDLVVEGNPNRTLSMNSANIGALNISSERIAKTPTLLGESDLIKTLQFEPGISAGIEGLAGMYVHGGSSDENLYMLDNIPLYQVNHLGGLFSAFNAEAIKNVDFYKSTFPAKFDGRLSSYMDVYTKDGANKKLQGSVKLGLTSGAFHIEGPIVKDKTTYSVSLRRSWYDILTIPIIAIVNKMNKPLDEDHTFGYAFTDINAKVTHKFSSKSRIYAMLYYGEDYLRASTYTPDNSESDYYDNVAGKLRWGNIVASAGWTYDINPSLWGKLTGAFTRYYSGLSSLDESADFEDSKKVNLVSSETKTNNSIQDWILKGDFEWRTSANNKFSFGTSLIFHDYLPSKNSRTLTSETSFVEVVDNNLKYKAQEFNLYGEDNLSINDKFKLSAGLHYSIFNITGKTKMGLSPRLAMKYSINDNVVVKGGYTRAVQYVHQLTQSSISLPTDQWVPIIGLQKPQFSDKIAAGIYWNLQNKFTFSAEAYYKWMHNLIDYRDEYYLLPPGERWDAKLAEGKGTAKGIDFKITKDFGRLTGQISYSLLWADRQFADRNGGKKYPARFDNRHKINILLNWKINDKWEVATTWTGMSGNRITLPLQCWSDPQLAPWHYDMLVKTDINNFRLPFYHRLDLSFTRYTKHGYWNFGLYNAYCN